MCKRLDEGNKAKWLGRLHIGAGLKSDPVMSSSLCVLMIHKWLYRE